MRGRQVEVVTRGARGDSGEKRMGAVGSLIWGLRGRSLGRCTDTYGAAGTRVCGGSGGSARHQYFGLTGTWYFWTTGSSSRSGSHQQHHQPRSGPACNAPSRVIAGRRRHVQHRPMITRPEASFFAKHSKLPNIADLVMVVCFLVVDNASLGRSTFATRSLN